MPKKKEEAEKDNAERWLLTYADMITLLMLFFIVLYSMSTIEEAKLKQVAQVLGGIFTGGDFGIFDQRALPGQGGVLDGGIGVSDNSGQAPADTPRYNTNRKARTERIAGRLKQLVQRKYVKVATGELGTVITLTSDLYFESGSGELTREAEPVLLQVKDVLSELKNNVRIEGHTDDQIVSMGSMKYKSNWDLSSQRAVSILEFFQKEGIREDRLSAVAFGSTRPLVPNDTPEDRALNRRVDIIIVDIVK